MSDRCLLYYITDRGQFRGDESARCRQLLAKVAEAARAGIDYIQLREKELPTRELERLARETVSVIRKEAAVRTEGRLPSTRLLVNSRADVALAVGADGVHLRADDVAPSEIQRTLEASDCRPRTAERFLVAVSCHTAKDVFRAASEKADFAVFAPVFEKNNAPGTLPAGLAALRSACEAKIPVLALGGVTIENAASCLQGGAAGIAGIRLFQQNKIEDVTRALRSF